MTAPRVTLRNLLTLLRLWWKLLACATLVGAVLGAAYSLTRRPIFESEALLTPVRQMDDLGQSGGALGGLVGQVAGMAGLAGLGSVGTTVDESVATLDSRQFALQFMQQYGVLQYLFPNLWNAKEHKWAEPAGAQPPPLWERLIGWLEPVPDSEFAWREAGPPPDESVKRFDRVRQVTVDRRTDFIRLDVRGPTPQTAQLWAAAMVHDLNDSMRNRTLEESRKAVDLLSRFIANQREESVRTAAAALLEAQLRREVIAESRQEFAVRVLDPPSLPDHRFYPRRGHMTLLGGLLGFVLATLGVVIGSAVRNERRLAGYAAAR